VTVLYWNKRPLRQREFPLYAPAKLPEWPEMQPRAQKERFPHGFNERNGVVDNSCPESLLERRHHQITGSRIRGFGMEGSRQVVGREPKTSFGHGRVVYAACTLSAFACTAGNLTAKPRRPH